MIKVSSNIVEKRDSYMNNITKQIIITLVKSGSDDLKVFS